MMKIEYRQCELRKEGDQLTEEIFKLGKEIKEQVFDVVKYKKETENIKTDYDNKMKIFCGNYMENVTQIHKLKIEKTKINK